ncbi:MAG: isopentenyl-diphosphate Delta-isomerase [Bacteroidales bacterium]
MTEKVILVDSNDTVIGEMEKLEAHQKARLHRAVSVFIFNSKGELLLQKRAESKYHSPGLWTNTACTHPRPKERNQDAAARRLDEEMGMNQIKLTKLFDFIYKEKFENGLTEYEFDHVFVGISDTLPIPEPTEVCDFEYIDCERLLEKIQKNPDNYTVWFKKIVNHVFSEVQICDLTKNENDEN